MSEVMNVGVMNVGQSSKLTCTVQYRSSHPESQAESDKFRKLMLKKQKRESKKPKNVLSEFKSEDIIWWR